MKLNDFQAGLALLANHFEKRDCYKIGSEHDQFYVYATDTPLTPEEAKQMHDLGWFQEGVEDGYNPGEGWTCFV